MDRRNLAFWGGPMKSRMASILLGIAVIAAGGGCSLHPPYDLYNGNTSKLPPMGKFTHRNNLPPAEMLMEPGPGVGGPGPGIMATAELMPAGGVRTSQVAFVSPEGMAVGWDVGAPGTFDSEPLIVPGRY